VKIIASSTLLFAYQVEEVLTIAKQLGYDGVEIWHFHLVKTGEEKKGAKLRKLAQQLDLSLSFHALSWDLNFTSKLDHVREASIDMLEKSLDIAAELDANPVVIHPGRITIPGDSAEAYWGFLIEGVKKLTSYAQKKDRIIGLEVMEHIPNEFFITPEDANHILDEITSPNLGITFDAAHVPLDIKMLDYLVRIKNVIHVHISDLTPHKRHIALNTGDRDFTDLIRYISSNNQADITIEGLEPQRTERLAQHNMNEIKRIIQSAENTKKN